MKRLLILSILVCALPTLAGAKALTLEELGALHPSRECFTLHSDLGLAGLSATDGYLDPDVLLEERGSDYRIHDVGDISFVGGPWTYETLSGDALYGSLNAFLATHENDYDFVSLFVTEHLNFGALYSPMQNDTLGIGSQVFDQTSESGYSELEGFLFMNSIFDYTGSIRDALFFGQEVGHRWGSFVSRAGGGRDMLGRDDAHWSFFLDSDNSTMEGNDWVEDGDGRWRTNVSEPVGYSQLDLYLMGLLPPEEVDDWLLIDDPVVVRDPWGWGGEGGINPATPPFYSALQYGVDPGQADANPIVVRGDEVQVAIEDVIAVNGPRVPASDDSQRAFRMAFIILHPGEDEIDFDDYLVIEDTREELASLWEGMVEDRATLVTRLGTSGDYQLKPSAFPSGLAFEPVPEEVIEDDPEGAGCAASLSGSAGALLALLPLAIRRRRAGKE